MLINRARMAGHQILSKAPSMSTKIVKTYFFSVNLIARLKLINASSVPLPFLNPNWSGLSNLILVQFVHSIYNYFFQNFPNNRK